MKRSKGTLGVAVNSYFYKSRITPNPSQKSLGGLDYLWYNKVMKHNRVVILISIIGLAALIFMLNNTSPTEIGPFGVLLFFTTLYVVCFGIMTFLLQTFSRIAFSRTATRGKDYLYSAIAAFAPIMLMMACSFGAINLWTVSLIGVFIILAEFLVYKKI